MISRIVFNSIADAKTAARELTAVGYLFNWDGALKLTIHDTNAYDVALCLTERYKAWLAPFIKPTDK